MDVEEKPVILIVDDEPLNIDLLREALKESYRIIIATRGVQAIALAQKKLPDLILLDIMMPDMDGYETCDKLKQIREIKDIPVIFITALSESEDKKAGYDAGAADYISKPFEIPDVLHRVNNHISYRLLQKKVVELQDAANRFSLMKDNLSQIDGLNTSNTGKLQLIKLFWSIAYPILLKHTDEDSTGKLKDIISQFDTHLKNLIDDSRKIANHISQSLQK